MAMHAVYQLSACARVSLYVSEVMLDLGLKYGHIIVGLGWLPAVTHTNVHISVNLLAEL